MSQNGRGEPPTTSRAAWTAIVVGVMNAAIILLPIDTELQNSLLTTLNPAAVGAAFLIHRYLDMREQKKEEDT